jgi:hypothetical protein
MWLNVLKCSIRWTELEQGVPSRTDEFYFPTAQGSGPTDIIIIMKQPVPCGFITKSKSSYWFSSSIMYYIKEIKNYFNRFFKKKKSDDLYDQFSSYR